MRRCNKQYVGSTTTSFRIRFNKSFRIRFNNHKSSCNRYGGGQRGICGEHLYAHFWKDGRKGLMDDVCVQVIDVTDIRESTC